MVQGIRAEERTPVSKTDIERDAIVLVNRGQEMPYLLGATPGVNFQSDSGIAAGYAYFNVRGIGQTRLNITLDGVPLQDPEDQALYFSNFGDFASVVDSIQVQRGVGTSSVGGASYGGSVNFASVGPADEPRLEAEGGFGSWGSARGTLAASGPVGSGFGLYGRYSAQTSDGFRDHSGVDQHTAWFGATHTGARSFFKLFGFSGREKSELAFLATDQATLESDLRHNDLTPDEKDDFGQDFVQAQYTWLAGSATTLSAQAYYNGASGWFRIWDGARENLQQFGIDGHFLGLVLGATHHSGRLGLIWGAHANDFTRDHFMDVVGGARSYTNTGRKNEVSSFLKATWDQGRTRLWADAQIRHARFEYQGDEPLGSVSWTFFNPKLGVRFEATPGPRALRLDRKDEPRAGAQRHAERRGQRDAALRPRGGRAGAGGGRRGRRRAPARQARPARGRLRDGVRERDRALRRAERDRPAGPPQRRPQPPSRRRARRRLRRDAEMALSARTPPSAATGSSTGRSSTTSTTRTASGPLPRRSCTTTSRRCSRRRRSSTARSSGSRPPRSRCWRRAAT